MSKLSNIDLVHYSAPLDVEIIRFSDLKTRASAQRLATPHRVDFCHLIVITQGTQTHMVDFVPMGCTEGSWLLVKPGQVHAFDLLSEWDGWLVVFKPEVLPAQSDARQVASASDMFESLPTLVQPDYEAHLAGLSMIKQMANDVRLYGQQSNGNLLMATALLHLLVRLTIIVGARSPEVVGQVTSNRFQRFKKLVETELHRQHHVHEYAQQLAYSEKTLNRTVLEVTGITAKAYLSQRIALQAKRLLVHTNQSVGAIGIELGFDEPTNFIKFFKREAGMLPTAFRQLYVRSDT